MARMRQLDAGVFRTLGKPPQPTITALNHKSEGQRQTHQAPFLSEAAGPVVQRQELSNPLTNVIQRQEAVSPSRDEMINSIVCGRGGQGLFGRTEVHDIYLLLGVAFYEESPDKSRAIIRDLRTGQSEVYKVGDRLDNEWEIEKIRKAEVILIDDTCRNKHSMVVDFQGGGDKQPTPEAPESPAKTPAQEEQAKVDAKDYGEVMRTDPADGGGKVVQYEDFTVEYYAPNALDQAKATYRLINGTYTKYAQNGVREGVDGITPETLGDALGVTIRQQD
ncbi:MAG: hypothetical protein AAGH78_08820 [Cyanobacteria bacterium P01_H01_bin.58]